MRYSTISFVAAASIPAALAEDAPLTSDKRGLCYVQDYSNSAEDLHIWTEPTDLTWYYNYQASPTSGLEGTGMLFVPMMWGVPDSDSDMTFYNTVKSQIDNGDNITYVLGFNEPDGCAMGGSCIPAEAAAAAWIREIEPLKEDGVLLGAPAVTGSPMGFTWLQNFFTACAGNCSADFIPVHWYGNFEGLASHVGHVNSTYMNMTMWITEYGLAGEDLEETQTFYNMSASWFETLDYLTHYSYFGAFRSDESNVGPNAAMLTQKGELTDIGANYLGMAATGNEPKGGAGQVAKFAGWTIVTLLATLWVLA